jgi:hypothetical protein
VRSAPSYSWAMEEGGHPDEWPLLSLRDPKRFSRVVARHSAGGRSNGRPFLGTGGFYPHSFTAVDVEGSIAVCPSLTIDSS